jgi:NADPH-dependent glutamate synthase beta subunit-like oxidoreductase
MIGGRLDVKVIPGTEEDIEADLIVSAIGQAVDFSGLEVLNNGKGAIASPTRTTRCRARRACSSAATWCARTC